MNVTSLSGDRIETAFGQAEIVHVPSGTTREFTADTGEQGVVLLDGAGEVLGHEVGRGAVVVIGHGRTETVRALDGGLTMLTLQAPVSRPVGTGTPSRLVAGSEIAQVTVHDPDRGFFRMTAGLAVSGPSGGHRAFTIGMSTFAPGEGCHDLHRHAHAEELFLVWQGEGVHLTAEQPPFPVGVGDLVWVPKNEEHGFRNTGPGVAHAVFCYLGVDDRSRAGYEPS